MRTWGVGGVDDGGCWSAHPPRIQLSVGDDTYIYKMKRTIRGKDELVLTGKELTRKLAVIVLPPRVHLVRFHGLFAPNAKHRAKVVPGGKKPARPCKESVTLANDPTHATASDDTAQPP